MVIVFDLDDTLYDELTYVTSGFKAVEEYLAITHRIPTGESFDLMNHFLTMGRGKIFDKVLTHYGCFTKLGVKNCLAVYRRHIPTINLRPEADLCLERLKHFPIYIVTDGNKIVQYNKIKALKLENRVKGYYITHRFGVKNAKPSPHCFLKICEREKTIPSQVMYIADNPVKDFIGIKPLGFWTVRLLRGQHSKVMEKSAEYAAQYSISSLDELDELIAIIRKQSGGNLGNF